MCSILFVFCFFIFCKGQIVKIYSLSTQVGVFPAFSGEEFVNFTALAEKLRSDYEFGHTLDAKLLPRGESSVTGHIVRLLKSFDELFVDFQVSFIFISIITTDSFDLFHVLDAEFCF
jgi:hypothetical protein